MAIETVAANARFRAKPRGTADDQWVEHNIEGSGFTEINFARSKVSRETPGGVTRTVMQTLPLVTGSNVSYHVDDIQVFRNLYWDGSCNFFDYEYFPQGMESGKPKIAWVGFLAVTKNIPEEDSMSFDLSAMTHGDSIDSIVE